MKFAELYSPVTLKRYRFNDSGILEFLSRSGVWIKSGAKSDTVKALQLRPILEQIKPVVVGWVFVSVSGVTSFTYPTIGDACIASRMISISTKTKNGKPVLRPVYKKD